MSLELLPQSAAGLIQPQIVTALPTSPYPGQLIVFTDSLTAPTYAWQLIYDASQTAANRWLYMGGSPLRNEVDANGGRSAGSGTYQNCDSGTTTIPTVTTPLAGDYDVHQGCWIQSNQAIVRDLYVSFQIGGTGATDTDSGQITNGFTFMSASVASKRRKTLAASTALAQKYKPATDVAMTVARRFIEIVPVRVG